jgi:hypothetical protein
MTPNLGVGAGRRPGARFQVDAGQQGPPGDPRLLLADVTPGEAVTVDEDGNPASLPVVNGADSGAQSAVSAAAALFTASNAEATR